jgi:streptogramin lyase
VARGRVSARFKLAGAHLDVLVRRSGVWVASEDGVARLDPVSGRVTARLRGGADTTFLAACAGSLWATNFMGSALWRIDERRAKVVARIRVPRGAAGLACANASLWVAGYSAGELLELSPSGSVVRRVATGSAPTDVVATADSVWVADSGAGTVTRVRLSP